MKITWKNIKESAYRLMFLEPREYESYDEAVIEAANYALVILTEEFPLKAVYDIMQTAVDEEGMNEYDLRQLSMQGDEETFLGFVDDAPILALCEGTGWQEAHEAQILLDRYVFLPKTAEGLYRVVYKKAPQRIDGNTAEEHALELSAAANNLMPLLMAYRVFKDDDMAKAAQYYNEFRDMLWAIKRAPTLRDDIAVMAEAGYERI